MPSLPVISGGEAVRALQRLGFTVVRQRGSHVVMQKKTIGSTITVPIPDHKEIRIGTLKSIIRQSQISSTEFEPD